MTAPKVRYVSTPTGDTAYTTLGDGPVDLVFNRSFPLNLEIEWENPAIERFYRRLASFARLVILDQHPGGLTGVSPSNPSLSIESWVDESIAVLDAVGSRNAIIAGIDVAAAWGAWLASAHPERGIRGIVMIDPSSRFTHAPDYEWGWEPALLERFVDGLVGRWGTGELLRASSRGLIDDQKLIDWYGRLERSCCPPAMLRHIWAASWVEYDLRKILPLIDCPTLVIVHPEHGYINPEHGRFIARTMPNARLVERPGPYATWWHDDVDATLDLIEEFVTGSEPATRTADRVLATVLFTDIVGSTERAAELGDARWREVLDIQGSVFERQLKRFNGKLINTAGDSLLATFDGPARAIRCGAAIRDDMRAIGIDLRVGVHTGEVELRGGDIGGLAVHVGSRVMSEARAGEILASSIVKDLVAGSGIAFEDRGVYTLKGIPDPWNLYAVAAL